MAFSGTDVSGPVSYTGADGQALPGAGIRGSGFGRVDTVAASAMGSARGLPSAYQQVKAAQDAAAARGDIDALQRVGAVSGGVPQTAMASGGRRTPAAFGFDPENRNAQAARKRVLDSLSNDSSLTRSQRAALAEVYRTQVGAESQTERLGAEARTADADRLARSQQSAAEISAENMRESGRSAINSRELALKEGEATDAGRLRDLEIGQAQRRASILARYDSAAPEERQSLVQQYPDVFGRADGSDWRVQVTPQTKNQDGSTTEGSVIRYNQRTGQVERVEGGGGQQAVAQLPARVGERQIGTIYAMPNGQAARWTSDGWELT
ncbi:hypothetical protein D8I35_05335 [Corticibacter populi]|uniref:Uncharacterized protein n=2 Tax=Corticibacter populi TaxID=1550736 RepID=A0A3M6QZW9_9BURK|nr:hypothetical protein D8I35_05335 [Corticibacter populi]